MRRTATCVGILLILSASHAAAQDPERIALARLRLTTEPSVVKGCARITTVRDDSVKDLRRKIFRAGGDTALLTFGLDDFSIIHADVYRCAHATQAPPPPPGTPPPPPGPPPPPPPAGPTR